MQHPASQPSQTTLRPTLRPFGLLRFVLAALVMLHHFGIDLSPKWLQAVVVPVGPGDMAVMVFFALSGFIILEAASFFYARRAWPFLANRALRIVPGYFAALIAAVLAFLALWSAGALRSVDGAALGPEVFSPRNVLANAVAVIPLSGRFGPAIDYLYLWPVWSLRVELVFYLSIFAAILVAARFGRAYERAFGAGLMALAAAGLAATLGAVATGADSSARFAVYFVFGGAVFLAARGSRAALAAAVLCVPVMLAQIWDYNPAIHAVLGRSRVGQVALLGTLLAAFVWLAVWSRRAPGRWDRYLGDLAYPLFLNHLTVATALRSLTAENALPAMLAGMALSVVLAAVMERLVEPAIRPWRNRWRGAAI
jgi:peptidoglycan/LPS O-acetylase OafA/YrhL